MTQQEQGSVGTAAIQGPLWSARARDWADTLEGPEGWGIPVYEKVLEATGVASGTTLLDVGCGAGRFCRLATDRGAGVAGIDAAEGLIAIAGERVPEGDFRVGDMEDLPWEDDSFDLVTGFSSFQFAAEPAVAIRQARRVARPGGQVTAVVPGAPERQELTAWMMALRPLLPAPPPGAEDRGPLALSREGALEALFEEAGLEIVDTDEVDTPMEFPDEATMLRGMFAAGPAVMAAHHAGEDAVRQATLQAMAPFRSASGGYRLENTAICVIGMSP